MCGKYVVTLRRPGHVDKGDIWDALYGAFSQLHNSCTCTELFRTCQISFAKDEFLKIRYVSMLILYWKEHGVTKVHLKCMLDIERIVVKISCKSKNFALFMQFLYNIIYIAFHIFLSVLNFL